MTSVSNKTAAQMLDSVVGAVEGRRPGVRHPRTDRHGRLQHPPAVPLRLHPPAYDRTIALLCNMRGGEKIGAYNVAKLMDYVTNNWRIHPWLAWLRWNVRSSSSPPSTPGARPLLMGSGSTPTAWTSTATGTTTTPHTWSPPHPTRRAARHSPSRKPPPCATCSCPSTGYWPSSTATTRARPWRHANRLLHRRPRLPPVPPFGIRARGRGRLEAGRGTRHTAPQRRTYLRELVRGAGSALLPSSSTSARHRPGFGEHHASPRVVRLRHHAGRDPAAACEATKPEPMVSGRCRSPRGRPRCAHRARLSRFTDLATLRTEFVRHSGAGHRGL